MCVVGGWRGQREMEVVKRGRKGERMCMTEVKVWMENKSEKGWQEEEMRV